MRSRVGLVRVLVAVLMVVPVLAVVSGRSDAVSLAPVPAPAQARDDAAMLEDAAAIDPLTELANYNVTWTSPSANSAGSMPIGNGDIGLNVWAQRNGDLMMYLSKSDAYNENSSLIKLGRLRISMSPNPFTSGQPFVQTMNLANGEILITAGSGAQEVRFRVWADANNPAVQIEADGDIDRSWTAELETWRTSTRTYSTAEHDVAYGVRSGPTRPTIGPDTYAGPGADAVTMYYRVTKSAYPDTLRIQSLYQEPGDVAPPDPLLNRKFGGTLYAEGFTPTSNSTIISSAPRADATFTYVALTDIASDTEWLDSLAQVRAAVDATQIGTRYSAHMDWWNAFWQRHWLFVTDNGQDPRPGSDTFAVTQGYLLQRMMQASASRGALPIKFNGSIFTVDATQSFDADYRRWGGPHWWQNLRLPYWSMLNSGDLDLMDPLFDMYLDALPLARERVETYYGHPGAYFPETMFFWGAWNNDNFGWNRSGRPLGQADNTFVRWEWQSGIELSWMMLLRYRMSPDDAFATEKLIPLATDIIDLYDYRFPRDADGEIRFTPAQALETYAGNTQNPAPEIAGLQALLTGLLDLPDSLTTPDRRAQWERLLGELPPVPVRSGALAPAEVIGPKQNSEKPELYPVFPYALYQVGKPDLNVANRAFVNRSDRNLNGWQQDAIFAAMLGRTNDAQSELVRRSRTKHSGSRFPAIWGPNYDWLPDQPHGGVNMVTLQKMLILEDGDQITLFPSWPENWDLDFKIHASGNTTITGTLTDGQVEDLVVSPPEREADITNLRAFAPVVAYTGAFNGTAWRLQPGRYPFSVLRDSPVGNDSISSLRIAPGYSVLACVNDFQGCRTFTESTAQLGGYNDSISSLEVIAPEIQEQSINGAVSQANGTVRGGVQVDLFAATELGVRGAFLGSTSSDASGLFTFDLAEAGCYLLTFIAPDGETFTNGRRWFQPLVCVDAGETAGGVDGVLADPPDGTEPSIGGTIAYVGGSPAVDVPVVFYTEADGGGRGDFLGSVRTGGDGRYAFVVTPGCYILDMVAPEGAAFESGRFRQIRACVEAGQQRDRIDGLLTSTAELVEIGGLIAKDGAPFAGANVDLFVANADGSRGRFLGPDVTGADGRYSFSVSPGCYVLTFIAPDGETYRGSRWYQPGVCVEDGQSITNLDAVLDP